MCLAIPSKVVAIKDNHLALVDTFGAQREVLLDLMPESIEVGDYILIHVGYAIGKLNEDEARKTLDLYKEIIDHE